MRKTIFKTAVMLMSSAVFTACVDDNYDLDNVNTDAEIKVNNLVVPVNLDKITLDRVLDIDENDPDATVVTYKGDDNKTYFAIRKTGGFNAEKVYIEKVNARVAKVQSVPEVNIPVAGNVSSVDVPRITTDFSYENVSVDKSIELIEGFGLDSQNYLTLNITISSSTPAITNLQLSELSVKLPKGFDATYNGNSVSKEGILYIGNVSGQNGKIEIPVTITALNLRETYPETSGLANPDGYVDISGSVGIEKATLSLSGVSGISEINLKADFSMSSFTVASFSGKVNYQIDSPAIQPVNLDDLPDFLTGEDTDIILYNPQIYLSINNGAGSYGVMGQSGLRINPWRENSDSGSLYLDSFQIGENNPSTMTYNIVMAPYPGNLPASVASQFPYLNQVVFSDLQYLLSGKGLPKEISFELVDPAIKGETLDFPLGTYLDFEGGYTFFTPLQFKSGSIIQYVKDETDWFDGDVDKMHISMLELDAVASTNLPFDVTLNAYPYIKDYSTDIVTLDRTNPAHTIIPANANSKEIKLNFEKEIIGLDGIYFEAIIRVQDEEALNEDQYIELDHIRAKVTGSYITKF